MGIFPVWEKKCTFFDINNYSFDRKTESLFLYLNIPATGLCLERHNEIHIPTNYS